MRRFFEPFPAIAFLVALTVAAHFALARHFGLYEDDYAFAGAALDWNAHWLANWVRFSFGPEGQGRPVGFILGAFLPWLGYHATGSLLGMYAIAAAVLSANVVLFHALLRRAAFPPPVPLLAAIALALFPADTTRAFLCHALILQPSLMFLLVALHLYLGGRRCRPWAYGVIVGSLLSYETAYLPFVAAPLLVPGVWNRRLPGRLVRHAGVLLAILIIAFLMRRWGGELRATDTIGTVHDLPRRIILGCLIGPGVALRQCAARAAEVVTTARVWKAVWPAVAAAVGPLAAAVVLAGRRAPDRAGGPMLARLTLCGVALLVPAYGLSFTHYPPDATYGRLTSVHVAAAPGAALLLAAATYGLLMLGRRARLFCPAAFVLAAYFAVLFGFAYWVQLGFARQWQEQRTYWTRILHLCPDATAGTVVLLRGTYLPESDFVLTQSWADYRVWAELLELPMDRPPLLVDFGGWEQCLDWHAGTFGWARLPHPYFSLTDGQVLPQGNTILLEVRDFHLYRVGGTVQVAGHPLALRPVPPGLPDDGMPAYPHRALYRLLIRP